MILDQLAHDIGKQLAIVIDPVSGEVVALLLNRWRK